MSALGSAGLQNSATALLVSLSDHPAKSSVLGPFCEELKVDEQLKISRQNFKQSIGDSFKDKDITPLSQLTAIPPFPTPHMLTQFASKTYTRLQNRKD